MSSYQIVNYAQGAIQDGKHHVTIIAEAPIGAVEVTSVAKQPSGLIQFVGASNDHTYVVRDTSIIGVSLRFKDDD